MREGMKVTEVFPCVKRDHKVWKGNRRRAWRLGATLDGRGALPTCQAMAASGGSYHLLTTWV